ncbi:hypothetical protein [Halpernia sp. GG3]
MSQDFYNPFIDLIFDEKFCFLSGDLTNETMTVFPQWLMDHFKFGDDKIEMMDKSKSYSYKDLILPCSPKVKKAFDDLDIKIQDAYKNGFEGMNILDEKLIFQWSGRIVYGFLYYEMTFESNRLRKQGSEFNLSAFLRERFGNFHLMLQSVFRPVKFVGKKPWTIVVFPLKFSADIFSFRDDAINLMFSFGVNGFGFISCLQDDGHLGEMQKDILEKIKGHILHPIQYQELFARFHYSEYIMQYKPNYIFENNGEDLTIEVDPTNVAQFGFWDEDMFAHLLSNYWQVYGIEKKEILKFQKPILSYLENSYSKDFILPQSIELPF